MNKLKESGWLKVELRGDGRGHSTHYRVAKPTKAEVEFPLLDTAKAELDNRLSNSADVIKAELQRTERRNSRAVKVELASSAEHIEESIEQSGGAYAPAAKFVPTRKSRSRKRGRRAAQTTWPEGFVLTAQMREHAAAKGCSNPDRAFEAFRDKSLAKGYAYASWPAAWRSWGWRADDDHRSNGASRPAPPLINADDYIAQMKAAQ
ncbi:MAG: hypothetical protein WBE69_15890 [Candidatus Binataceae bacterium]